MTVQGCEFILYCSDQEKSRRFYQKVLGRPPLFHEPGMTQFELVPGVNLGLMPEKGIKALLGEEKCNPSPGAGIPRCELYLLLENPEEVVERAQSYGGRLLSPLKERDWGDSAAYLMDPDGHIIAFARRYEKSGGER